MYRAANPSKRHHADTNVFKVTERKKIIEGGSSVQFYPFVHRYTYRYWTVMYSFR